MLALNHTLVGAAIGSQIDNIPAVIGLSVASHFVIDALPHLDQGLEKKDGKDHFKFRTKYLLASIDIALALVMLAFILSFKSGLNKTPIIVGAVSGLSIDIIFNVPLWQKWVKKTWPLSAIARFHELIHQPFKRYQYSVGIPLQIIIVIISLWVLLK